MTDKYHYTVQEARFAQVLLEEISSDIQPSENEWERGYNAGVRSVVRKINRYLSIYRQKRHIAMEG